VTGELRKVDIAEAAENRGQRPEVRDQEAEGGGQRPELEIRSLRRRPEARG